MFGKKKTFSSVRIDTLIGQGTEITGDISFSGGLHIDGIVRGNVKGEADGTTMLILSEFGEVEGEINVPSMVLNGKVTGDVHSSIRVELASKSRISGSVYYNLIEMSIGAEVNGGLVHRPGESDSQKALEHSQWKVPADELVTEK
jgi:cytoskeletal protein CcmA (bactofilin family)